MSKIITRPRVIVSWSLAGLCLAVSLFVQSRIITRAPFHMDEAFYTGYSRDLLHGHPLLTSQGVEKPPVYFYWQALFMAIGGEGQKAARLPNVAAFVIAIVFAFRMTRRIYDDVTAGTVAVLLALSPFMTLFGPTAFTDMLAVALAIGSLERLSAKKWFWSGVLAAGAMFTKQYYGLFLGYGLLAMRVIPSLRPQKSEWKQWAKGVVLTSLPVIFWSTFLNRPPWNIVRIAKHVYHDWQTTPAFWVSVKGWLVMYGWVFGSVALTMGCLAGAAYAFWVDREERVRISDEKVCWDVYWLLVVVSFFLALVVQRHIPHYDRYILLTTIPCCILAGRGIVAIAERLPAWGAAVLASGVLYLLGTSLYANVWLGGYNFGANFDQYVGLDGAFAYATKNFPSADGVLITEESGFLQRYYAYRAPYAVLSFDQQDMIHRHMREYAFNPIWLLANTDNADLDFKKWPKDFAALWAPRQLFQQGHYAVWEFIPDQKWRIASGNVSALAAGLQRLWQQPVRVRKLGNSRYEIRGQHPLREGMIAAFTSTWSNVLAYGNSTMMAGTIQETRTTFELKTDAAAAALALRNPNIHGLRFRVDSDRDITISGTVNKPSLPFEVKLRPAIAGGRRIQVELVSARAGALTLPGWFCRWASRYIPPQKIGLPYWAGEASEMHLDPKLQTALISSRLTR